MRRERDDDKRVTRTAGEVFPDGGGLELVRIPDGELALLAWNGQSAKTATRFTWRGQTFAPLQMDPSILLPDSPMEHGSTRKLFAEILDVVSRVTRGAPDVAKLITFFVFATWLVDTLPLAPTLWVVCPPTAASGPLLQVLRQICRRALVLNDFSAPKLFPVADRLRPTLLTEIVDPTRAFLNTLRASTRRGAVIASDGRFVNPYCAKIVFASEPLHDSASAGFSLEVVLPAAGDYVPQMSAAEAGRLAAQYQPKLLNYRLSNLAKVRTPAFDLAQFTPSLRDLVYSLGACVVGDDELQAEIVTLLKPIDSETRVGHTSILDAIVLEVLLAHCHKHTGKYCSVIDLTADVNTLRLVRGEQLAISPESVGWVLRGLGLHTDFISGARKGLILSQDVRDKIHNLAASYGVRTLREPSAAVECTLCAALEIPRKVAANAPSKMTNPS